MAFTTEQIDELKAFVFAFDKEYRAAQGDDSDLSYVAAGRVPLGGGQNLLALRYAGHMAGFEGIQDYTSALQATLLGKISELTGETVTADRLGEYVDSEIFMKPILHYPSVPKMISDAIGPRLGTTLTDTRVLAGENAVLFEVRPLLNLPRFAQGHAYKMTLDLQEQLIDAGLEPQQARRFVYARVAPETEGKPPVYGVMVDMDLAFETDILNTLKTLPQTRKAALGM